MYVTYTLLMFSHTIISLNGGSDVKSIGHVYIDVDINYSC